MNKKIITLSICASMFLTGCSVAQLQEGLNKNAGKVGGTGIGLATGYAIGHKIAGKEGAIVGALIGGTIGYFIGSNIDERRAAIEQIAKNEKINVYFEDIKDADGDKIGQSFITEDKYQFDTGSDVLNKKAKNYFTEFAKQYAKSGQKVLIIGHTDDRGSDAYNYELSERRAKAVAQVFKDSGVDAKNIYIYGLGETKPIASNLNKEGQGKNRRVEIVEAPSEKDIARYAYMKPTNSKLLNKEKTGNYNVKASKKGKELSKNPNIENAEDFVNTNLPKEYLDNLAKINEKLKKENLNNFDKKDNNLEKNNKNQNLQANNTLNKPDKDLIKNSNDIENNKKESEQNQGISNNKIIDIPKITFNLDGTKLNTYGNGNISKQNDGQCNNDFLYAPKDNKLSTLIDGGKRYNITEGNKDFEKVVGIPIEKSNFSIMPKLYANTSNTAFDNSCLQDSFKEKGVVKNFETGREVLIEKTVTQIPWLAGTMWYSNSGDNYITLSPISVSVENVEPITCPSVNITKNGSNYPIYGVSTKIVTRQGDKGFIYRVYPTIKNKDSKFECIDIAFSDKMQDKAIGNIYYEKGGKYYKKEVEFQKLVDNRKEEKGLFSW